MMQFLLSLLLISAVIGGRVQQCMTTYHGTIRVKSINVIPANFNAGDYVELSIKLDNQNNTLNSGFIHYTILHDGEEYEPQVDDLCSIIKCPIEKGLNDISFKFKMPQYLEPIQLFIELVDYNGYSFTCGRIKVEWSLWNWIVSWVLPRPNEPIVDVRRSLRGYDTIVEMIETHR